MLKIVDAAGVQSEPCTNDSTRFYSFLDRIALVCVILNEQMKCPYNRRNSCLKMKPNNAISFCYKQVGSDF